MYVLTRAKYASKGICKIRKIVTFLFFFQFLVISYLQVFIRFYFIEKLSLVCTHTPVKVKRDLLFYSSDDLVTSYNGTIFSPSWPLKYPQEKKCWWQFSPPLGKIVRLFFTSVEFEGDISCTLFPGPSAVDDFVILNGTVI